MISNEGRFTRPQARPPYHSDHRPNSDRQPQFDRPRPAFESLGKQVVEGPRKRFTLEHRRNAAGEFIQVTEESLNGRRNLIVIPAEAAVEFAEKLDEMVQILGTAAAK